MSAWDDEVGSPSHQVMRSHTIAPTSPARITVASTMARSTSPFPIVLATAVPNTKTAMKLNVAAQTTAADGDRTRVETTVAIDRKSTRLNSSHGYISYAVFCLKKKKTRD